MKANEAPEKLYLLPNGLINYCRNTDEDVEYTSTGAFIKKTKEWFEQQPETYDANGVRCYSTEDFEDFVNYMKRE
jgi:hypothetical protein